MGTNCVGQRTRVIDQGFEATALVKFSNEFFDSITKDVFGEKVKIPLITPSRTLADKITPGQVT